MQVQDSALDSIGKIVSRIGELQGMYNDVTKSTADKALYDIEFTDLKAQITAIASNTVFNGIDVFGGAGTLEVFLNEDQNTAGGSLTITDVDVDAATDMTALLADTSLADIPTDESDGDISQTLEEVAGHRATNGGEVRRLQYALANVQSQITNLSAANGRIVDVDIAAESSNLAKQQVLVQASAAMTAQANVANDVALMLLQ